MWTQYSQSIKTVSCPSTTDCTGAHSWSRPNNCWTGSCIFSCCLLCRDQQVMIVSSMLHEVPPADHLHIITPNKGKTSSHPNLTLTSEVYHAERKINPLYDAWNEIFSNIVLGQVCHHKLSRENWKVPWRTLPLLSKCSQTFPLLLLCCYVPFLAVGMESEPLGSKS